MIWAGPVPPPLKKGRGRLVSVSSDSQYVNFRLEAFESVPVGVLL